ncbi:DEAD/DEAH box helicase [bacterium]|nr:DEAD/DEAH box helicase [bacterium]
MNYRGFELDLFQEEALASIDHHESVLVSAPTGAGKTLIADYAVEKVLAHQGKCVYTSPLKALSNQKFRDFTSLLGQENVGIMTGDVVIRIDAPLLIMTTEVLRNILHRDPGRLDAVEYVIFDELHFLANEDRGTVWEECLILLPETIRFIGLSATVKNVAEIGDWLTEIKGHPVKVIKHDQRPVPLKILGFTRETGLSNHKKIDDFARTKINKNRRLLREITPHQSESRHSGNFENKYASLFQETSHRDIIEAIMPDYLPCLFFIFSRQGCETAAHQLTCDLTSTSEKAEIDMIVQPLLVQYGAYEATSRLTTLLRRGIGYHHAGLFPFLKETVETLYERKLIKVLYCTSTFALGINMPAKTVLFDRMVKFDGKKLRYLTALEFFQKAGRAGRRGLDPVGYVIINRNLKRDTPWQSLQESDIEPILSALNLSYNSIINLLEKYTLEEIKKLLGDSLWTFQHRNQIIQQEELLNSLLNDINQSSQISLDHDPHEIDHHKQTLEQQYRLYERKRTEIFNQLHHTRHKKTELRLAREINNIEKKLRNISDEKKNVEVLNIVLKAPHQHKPSKKVRKLFTKLRRTKEQIQYFQDYLFNIFQEKLRVLIDLDFVSQDLQLLSKAEICKYLYIQELFVTELLYNNVLDSLDELELNALLNCIGQSERKRDLRKRRTIEHPLKSSLMRKIKHIQQRLRDIGADRFDPLEFNLNYATVAYLWSKGFAFADIVKASDLQEGDIISSFRQTIDLLKQLKDVYRNDPLMITRFNTCIDCLDRDVVKVVI